MKKKDGFDGQQSIVIPRKILEEQCARNELTAGLYITDMGYYPKARFHHRVRPEGVDQHILIYCVDGRGSARFNRQTFAIGAGDFFVIPRKTAHIYRADEDDPWTIYWVHFVGSASDAVARTLEHKTASLKSAVPWLDQRIALFGSIYRQLESGYDLDNILYANLCFGQFLASLLFPERFTPDTTGNSREIVATATRQMKLQIGGQLTLQQLAEEANLSVSHFVHQFKKKTGYTPIEYFNNLKVQKACELLLYSDMRIKEVAASVGMSDPYYFSRFFTRLMGISPNHYRQQRGG
ncbi:AraC family transcriptional regulator [Chitinophaga rhizosphaerae]|uniref:AraC family transcriptional regulator n=1 Tax=Chitinophaga rhizosphaerae TaxID=1864947 RepID=UPI000F80EDE7|nr:AraC family transcriptional regulator [Chitinophaga rhizosphaerae]